MVEMCVCGGGGVEMLLRLSTLLVQADCAPTKDQTLGVELTESVPDREGERQNFLACGNARERPCACGNLL